MTGPHVRVPETPERPAAAVSLVARACLFVALSAFAVPACQYYESGDGREQSARLAAPAHGPAAAATSWPDWPRA